MVNVPVPLADSEAMLEDEAEIVASTVKDGVTVFVRLLRLAFLARSESVGDTSPVTETVVDGDTLLVADTMLVRVRETVDVILFVSLRVSESVRVAIDVRDAEKVTSPEGVSVAEFVTLSVRVSVSNWEVVIVCDLDEVEVLVAKCVGVNVADFWCVTVEVKLGVLDCEFESVAVAVLVSVPSLVELKETVFDPVAVSVPVTTEIVESLV